MKGMTIGRGMKRPTKSGAGMTKKGVAKYRSMKTAMKKGKTFSASHKKAMKKVGR
jgi:hypothetical protein